MITSDPCVIDAFYGEHTSENKQASKLRHRNSNGLTHDHPRPFFALVSKLTQGIRHAVERNCAPGGNGGTLIPVIHSKAERIARCVIELCLKRSLKLLFVCLFSAPDLCRSKCCTPRVQRSRTSLHCIVILALVCSRKRCHRFWLTARYTRIMLNFFSL